MVKNLYVETYDSGHIQGIAIDKDRKYMYCSFTTELIKYNMNGEKVASVKGLLGHLGCIAYNYEDGKVYGSLEFKHDAIGKGILKFKDNKDVEDGFYIAIFDVEKMDRLDMDAEKDGIMKTVFLKEVYDDYSHPNHKYGCSGIDGTTIAPDFGKIDGEKFLFVAYGIYGDISRDDNDNQIILKYSLETLNKYAMALNQGEMHRSGPSKPDSKYFVYTGNTEFGIQNLEYDPYNKSFLACVYSGRKDNYPNYSLFLIDHTVKPIIKEDPYGIEREFLTLKKVGEYDEKSNLSGYYYKRGSTGIISLYDGTYYISHEKDDWNKRIFTSNICLMKWDDKAPFINI